MAIPFFSFPKTLQREKEKIRIIEKAKSSSQKEKEQCKEPKKEKLNDSGYGKDVKGKRLILEILQQWFNYSLYKSFP